MGVLCFHCFLGLGNYAPVLPSWYGVLLSIFQPTREKFLNFIGVGT